MNTPFKAGRSGKKTFKKDGLKAKLKVAKQRDIVDGGYTGHPKLSTPNPYDLKKVRVFRSRALKWHKAFNGMTKHFECLSVRFRHGGKFIARLGLWQVGTAPISYPLPPASSL